MCNNLTTHEGYEIWSLGELRRFLGSDPAPGVKDDECLCCVEMGDVLPADRWRGGHFDWAEIGPDGKTWAEGYDIEEEAAYCLLISRSDGRNPARTLDEVLAARAAQVRT